MIIQSLNFSDTNYEIYSVSNNPNAKQRFCIADFDKYNWQTINNAKFQWVNDSEATLTILTGLEVVAPNFSSNTNIIYRLKNSDSANSLKQWHYFTVKQINKVLNNGYEFVLELNYFWTYMQPFLFNELYNNVNNLNNVYVERSHIIPQIATVSQNVVKPNVLNFLTLQETLNDLDVDIDNLLGVAEDVGTNDLTQKPIAYKGWSWNQTVGVDTVPSWTALTVNVYPFNGTQHNFYGIKFQSRTWNWYSLISSGVITNDYPTFLIVWEDGTNFHDTTYRNNTLTELNNNWSAYNDQGPQLWAIVQVNDFGKWRYSSEQSSNWEKVSGLFAIPVRKTTLTYQLIKTGLLQVVGLFKADWNLILNAQLTERSAKYYQPGVMPLNTNIWPFNSSYPLNIGNLTYLAQLGICIDITRLITPGNATASTTPFIGVIGFPLNYQAGRGNFNVIYDYTTATSNLKAWLTPSYGANSLNNALEPYENLCFNANFLGNTNIKDISYYKYYFSSLYYLQLNNGIKKLRIEPKLYNITNINDIHISYTFLGYELWSFDLGQPLDSKLNATDLGNTMLTITQANIMTNAYGEFLQNQKNSWDTQSASTYFNAIFSPVAAIANAAVNPSVGSIANVGSSAINSIFSIQKRNSYLADLKKKQGSISVGNEAELYTDTTTKLNIITTLNDNANQILADALNWVGFKYAAGSLLTTKMLNKTYFNRLYPFTAQSTIYSNHNAGFLKIANVSKVLIKQLLDTMSANYDTLTDTKKEWILNLLVDTGIPMFWYGNLA